MPLSIQKLFQLSVKTVCGNLKKLFKTMCSIQPNVNIDRGLQKLKFSFFI